VFFWKKRRKPKRRSAPPRRARVTETQRQSYRASFEFDLAYALDGRDGTRGATATDLSAGGLRLIGDEDLADGTTLALRFTLPNDLVRGVHVEKETLETTPRGKVKKKIIVPPDPFKEMTVRAEVVIPYFLMRRKKFAHGLRFLDVDARTEDEIQRFIHVWQIRQLRERAHQRGE